MKTLLSLFAAKITAWAIKEYNLGAGSTWPGHVALLSNPHFIKDYLKHKKLQIILIAGTNGKTTTSKMLRQILEDQRIRVIQNEEGANLLNGMATSLIKNSSRFGKIKKDIAIFEVDENNLPLVLEQITPQAIVLLNIFRDQLDRYGEVNAIARRWLEALKKLPSNRTQFIINADDPQLQYIGMHLSNVTYFGLPSNKMAHAKTGHDVDSVYCPNCGTALSYSSVSYSHLGDYVCPKCSLKRETIHYISDLNSPLAGTYNQYNTYASGITAHTLFHITVDELKKSIASVTPAFGRQESIEYKEKTVTMLLSKNPTGFNQSIEAVQQLAKTKKHNVLLVLNDRIPDGADVSWIWDMEIDKLTPLSKHIYLAGDRVYDMALRVKYSTADMKSVSVYENLKKAIDKAVSQTAKGETLFIFPTYSAMLESRKILTGKSIL